MAAHRLTATREAVAEKLESQKLLALSFQEKGMLDMALATFNKLPFTQDMKHVYLNLGLDYENRGQRDKAFLVYKKIFDIDPAFEDVAARMARLEQAGAAVSPPPVPATPDALVSRPPVGTSDPCEEAPTPVWPVSAGVRSAPAPAPVADVPYKPGSVPSRSAAEGIAIANSAAGGPVRPGSRFLRYEVEQYLGGGGMGDVYLVRDTVINRKAALKTIRGDTRLNPQQIIKMRQRFYREARTAGKLAHPNIVTVYDVGEDLGLTYIVMEFVEGNTLAQLMAKKRLSLPQIKHVISSAALGLDHAHQNGVFHRDVKPDNILVSRTGMVKVMDFGIARILESNLTKTGSLIGTPSYMSPEQVHGEKVDARSDVFSLGVILYELLTGKKPFTGETMSSLMFAIMHADPTPPSAIDSRIDAAWDDMLRKALSKEPEGRYKTAGEFAQAVKSAPVR
jgi:predicted Ser/Thr protein kinase